MPNSYDPPTLKVAKGTTVTWKNADSTLHTVTSGTAEGNESGTAFDSSYLAAGKTFPWTFSTQERSTTIVLFILI